MLTKTKILAIGKDTALLRLLEKGLNEDNYEVATTQHAGNSLKYVLDTENPNFIILDIMMPNLDGIGVCLTLRQWTQAPILLLSTWGTRDGMVRGLNLGSESYLSEPFDIEELKTRINETLKRNAEIMTDPLANIYSTPWSN